MSALSVIHKKMHSKVALVPRPSPLLPSIQSSFSLFHISENAKCRVPTGVGTVLLSLLVTLIHPLEITVYCNWPVMCRLATAILVGPFLSPS